MMTSPEHLLLRLEEIARSLETDPCALALLGLGSVGTERARLDCYSDLDFFAIVSEGSKAKFLNDLSWLTRVAPAAYLFRNTKDGYKFLYEDGIFCEFAVFELAELSQIAYAKGKIIWKREGVTDAIAVPMLPLPRGEGEETEEFLLGEALTNIFVGLSRLHRGEKLSAARFIQHYAVDRVLALADRLEPEHEAMKDAFARERRFEQRFPELSKELPSFIQGYERTTESARALLAFIEAHFSVNENMARAIRALL